MRAFQHFVKVWVVLALAAGGLGAVTEPVGAAVASTGDPAALPISDSPKRTVDRVPADAQSPEDAPPIGDGRGQSNPLKAGKGFDASRSTLVPELTTDRKEVFANPDGSRTARVTQGPTRVPDGAGGWRDIDLALRPDDKGGFAPAVSLVPLVIPSDPGLGIGGVATAAGDFKVGFPDVAKGAGAGVVKDGGVTYPGPDAAGTSVKVVPTVNGFESSVVYGSAAAANSSYLTDVTVPAGVTAKPTDGGTVAFFDAAGAQVAVATGGSANDAEIPTVKAAKRDGSDRLHATVTVRLVGQVGTTVSLEYAVDDAWLKDPARVFPVVLDPGWFWLYIQTGSGYDTFVDPFQPNTSMWSNQELWIGNNQNLSASETLLYFDLNSAAVADRPAPDKAVTAAILTVNSAYAFYATQTSCYAGNRVEVHSLAEGTAGAFGSATTWNSRPSTDGGYPFQSKLMPAGDPNKNCSFTSTDFDVKDLAQRWMRTGRFDTKANFGMELRAPYGDPSTFEALASGETIAAARLDITYVTIPDATAVAPNDQVTIATDRPTFQVSAPVNANLQCLFRIANGTDAETGVVVSQSSWVPCSGGASWKIAKNQLADGHTYYWHTWMRDSQNLTAMAMAPWARSFTVNRRFGAGGPTPSDTAGPVAVNLATGNVSFQTASPSFPTVAGSVGVSFAYNSGRATPHGLNVNYFNDSSTALHLIDPPVVTKVDRRVSHNFSTFSPTADGTVHKDQFSARWTGYLTVPTTGSYTLGGIADDGYRVNLNLGTGMNTIMDQWTANDIANHHFSPAVTLTANQPYPISIEYFEATGSASAVFEMTGPGNTGSYSVSSDWLTPAPPAMPEGWSMGADLDGSNTFVSAVADGARSVAMTNADGVVQNWQAADGGGGWVPPKGADGVLTGTPGGILTLSGADGQISTFGTDGNLTSVTSGLELKKPASVQYGWVQTADVLTRLKTLTDPVSGRVVTLTYGLAPSAGADPCPTNGTSTRAPSGMLCKLDYGLYGLGTTKLYYSAGYLARIEDPGSELTDFHYNSNGLLDWIKDPLALDMIAAGKRADDGTAQTDITYEATSDPNFPLWAASVTAAAPTAGAVRPQHSYGYTWFGVGVTDVHVAGASEPNGWSRRVEYTSGIADDSRRLMTNRDAANLATTYAYNDLADAVSAVTDPALFETTTVFDYRQRPVTGYGPAPSSCFTAAGLPVAGPPAQCPNPMPVSTTNYDEGIKGLAATYWDNPNLGGPPQAVATGVGQATGELNKDWLGAAPNAGVPADNWSARYSGDIRFDANTDYNLRVDAADGAGVRATIDGRSVLSHWNGPNRPELVSTDLGHQDLFMRGPDDALWHKSWDASAIPQWSQWDSLGGVLTSDPGACVRNGTGRTDVFVRGTDGAVWQRFTDRDGWHPWMTLGGAIVGAPDCASWDENHVTVGARGTNNALYIDTWAGAGWTWSNQGGTLTSSPSLTSWSAGRVDVVASGAASALYHTYYFLAWSNLWDNLGGTVVGDPTAVSWGPNRIDVFVRDTGNALEHKSWDGSAWSNFDLLGGVLTTSPGATSSFPGTLDSYTRGTDDQLYQLHYGGTWGLWGAQFALFRTGTVHVQASGTSLTRADGSINVIDGSVPHRLTVELADRGGNANIKLSWAPNGSGYVTVPGDHLNARYGLVTSAIDADGHRSETGYTGQGFDPALGIATVTKVDPAGLNLQTNATYDPTYYRRTAKALPKGDVAVAAKRISDVSYLGTGDTGSGGNAEPRNMPTDTGCAMGTNINQGGLPKLTTDPMPSDPTKQTWHEVIYDEAGRAAATRENGDTRWTCVKFDARGRTVDSTDRAGNASHSQYYGAPSDATCGAVDPNVSCGRYVDSAGVTRSTRATVDLLGRTTSYTDEQGTVTRNDYDQAGRVVDTWRTLPASAETHLGHVAFDTYNRVSATTEYVSLVAGRTTTLAYDAAGRAASTSLPTTTQPTVSTNTYDATTGRRSNLATARNGVTFWNEAIGYTTGGMLNLDWSTAGIAQYGYDQASRLTSTTVGGVLARSYAFDANTNRCANAASCAAPTFTYDQADRLTASPYGSAYVYDTHGNLASYTKAGGGTVSFQYDAYDHATRIDDGTTRTDEVLAPSGRVLKRTVTSPPGGTVTENTVKGYTGGGDSPNWSQPVAGGTITTYLGTAIVTGTTAVYQVSNWHGDIVGTVTQAGAFTAQAYPDEYGNMTTAPASRLGWLGAQQRFVTAPALGIIRMGVRLYDPKLGRFLAQDPVEGGSCNDYDYTCANPIAGLDLSGTNLFSKIDWVRVFSYLLIVRQYQIGRTERWHRSRGGLQGVTAWFTENACCYRNQIKHKTMIQVVAHYYIQNDSYSISRSVRVVQLQRTRTGWFVSLKQMYGASSKEWFTSSSWSVSRVISQSRPVIVQEGACMQKHCMEWSNPNETG